jgi:putative protease
MVFEKSKDNQVVGVVTHYFSKIGVAAVKLSGKIKIGDRVRYVGNSTDFEDEITSIQLEHKNVSEADAPSEVGVTVKNKVREGDKMYLI